MKIFTLFCILFTSTQTARSNSQLQQVQLIPFLELHLLDFFGDFKAFINSGIITDAQWHNAILPKANISEKKILRGITQGKCPKLVPGSQDFQIYDQISDSSSISDDSLNPNPRCFELHVISEEHQRFTFQLIKVFIEMAYQKNFFGESGQVKYNFKMINDPRMMAKHPFLPDPALCLLVDLHDNATSQVDQASICVVKVAKPDWEE